MRSSMFQFLLLAVLPGAFGQSSATTCEVAGSSSRYPECKGIQGTGKNADICCAEECLCTCGGSSAENAGKECFISGIRASPPPECDGTQLPTEACALGPEPVDDSNHCGVTDGILSTDDDQTMCCPTGCDTCGGSTCSTMPMSWVQPGDGPLSVDPSVPEGATSADYCCLSAMETLTTVCGVDGGEAPCRMPQVIEEKVDTCGVEGIIGTAHSSGGLCCPLGCDSCGTTGCGDQHISYIYPGDLPWSTTAPDGMTSADVCCLSAFKTVGTCGVDATEPPCYIPDVEVTLPPREDLFDTCGVDGIEGIANGNKCCPLGCGQCGGSGCGNIDMGYITPTLGFDPPADAKSSMYCCTSSFDESTPTCGEEGALPPCYIDDSTTQVSTETPVYIVDADAPNTCGLPDVTGIADSSGTRCCPQGCGMCGGIGCGSVNMDLVRPTVVGGVPADAKSSEYCCSSGVDERGIMCGTGDGEGHAPCSIPADTVEDSCHVDGIEGVSDSSKQFCCPLGCGLCGGTGCGGVPKAQIFNDGRTFPAGATSGDYCCVSGFESITDVCGDPEVEPPCLIPEGTVFPEVPTPAPVAPATPAPDGGAIGGDDAGNGVDDDLVGDGADDGAGDVGDDDVGGEGSDNGDGKRGGIFTSSPSSAPSSSESMSCKHVSVTIEDAEEFDGIFVMMDDTLFVRDDLTALLIYVPYEGADVVESTFANSTANDTITNTNSTMITTINSTNSTALNSTTTTSSGTSAVSSSSSSATESSASSSTPMTTDTAARTRRTTGAPTFPFPPVPPRKGGRWVLVPMVNDSYSLDQYPQVSTQDCAATHPEDIDSSATWMMQTTSDSGLEGAMTGFVECVDSPISVAPGTPTPLLGDGASASPTALTDRGIFATPAPTVATSAPGADAAPTVEDTDTGDAEDTSSASKGLSSGEAVGAAVSVLAVVGGLGIAPWTVGVL